MKRIVAACVMMFIIATTFGQEITVSGIIKDAQTGELLIGATVMYGPGKGTVTNYDGKFALKLPPGDYTLSCSYVGYEDTDEQITITDKPVILSIGLQSMTLDEVVIVADMAISRETPVAFTNVNPAKIEEELAGQDIPMILNTTPGVYATQQGGGDGDARITIRGFSQRNLAVMIDGIPVNDMENGWVYWSNWFGLDLVTRTMQVQRGLGASQLALPSVGGTINILTRGIENKKQFSFKQTMDSQLKLQTSIGFTSGNLPGNWGITVAGAYKKGNGWVDNTFSEGWFYYTKVDKRLKNHLVTFTAMGAPQMHDQRSYELPISAYDSTYAINLGINMDTLLAANRNYKIFDAGIGYNQHWGNLTRNRVDPDAPEETLSERSNQYHKPQFTLRDFWTITEKFTVSNNLYLSIGKGGGDTPLHSMKYSNLIGDPDDPEYGQINWQRIYDANWKGVPPIPVPPIVSTYSDTLTNSGNYMLRQHNEHFWYGILTKANYAINPYLKISGGIDLRSYKGVHYSTVRDLLGGDYAIDVNDTRINYKETPLKAMKYVGDTVDYYYDGLVRWGGLFSQMEYSRGRYSTFINLTTAVSGYNKIDYFEKAQSGWIYKQGFTVKAGANYNLTDHANLFINMGYLSRVRAYRYFYRGYTTDFQDELDNELVKAIEAGYTYGSPRFSLFLNTYYTLWENKPPDNQIRSKYVLQPGDPGYREGDETELEVYADIPGIDARHTGVELDLIYSIRHNLNIQGTFSLGDWIWDSYVTGLQYYLSEGEYINQPVAKVLDFDARGIHVSDAAQLQLGSSIRYEPVKGLYINLRQTYFGKYYSEFSPEATTDDEGNVHDSWKLPDFNLFDLHSGYSFRVDALEDAFINIRFSLLNILDTKYIWDATNNDPYGPYSEFQDFDAKSATVFFGMGRRFITSVGITF